MSPGAPRNPFSTRFLALPYQGDDVAALLAALRLRGEGQLIGPEGTGKSTLLRALLAAASREPGVAMLAAQGRGRRLPSSNVWNFCRSTRPGEPRLLLLDSAEELAAPARWLLRALCRRRGVALLLSGHRPLGPPTLRATAVSDALAVLLAEAVLAQSPSTPRLVEPREIVPALRATGGNLREALLRLYDLHEERWRQGASPAGAR